MLTSCTRDGYRLQFLVEERKKNCIRLEKTKFREWNFLLPNVTLFTIEKKNNLKHSRLRPFC